MEHVEVLPMILREMKRSRFTKADMARELNIQPSSIQGMFKRQTLQVQKLIELSSVFQYNFFREIAGTLPYVQPNDSAIIAAETEKTAMQERIKALELEVSILRQTIKDMVAR